MLFSTITLEHLAVDRIRERRDEADQQRRLRNAGDVLVSAPSARLARLAPWSGRCPGGEPTAPREGHGERCRAGRAGLAAGGTVS